MRGEIDLKRSIIAIALIVMPSPAFAGAVDKFDKRRPEIEGHVNKSMYDIERCLLHMDRVTMPFVYRQPDRPDDTMLIWQGADNMISDRVDLKRDGDGTFVRSWMGNKAVRECMPLSDRP